MIHVERISTVEQFSLIEHEWRLVLSQSGSDNIHLTHDWLSIWINTLGYGKELLVLRVKEGDETIAFVPLMIKTVWLRGILPYRKILFIGDPDSDFGDFLIVRKRRQVIEAVLEYLLRRHEWGEILLHNIPQSSPNVEALRAALSTSDLFFELIPKSPCYFIPLREMNWDEYYRTTSKSFVQKDLRRLCNHFAKMNYEIRQLDGENISQAIPIFARLHQLSQENKGNKSYYKDGRYCAFLDTVMPMISKKGWSSCHVLRINGQPASFMLGFEYNRVFYWWQTGFDPAYRQYSPTKFFLYKILQSGFEQRLWDEFNFMRGDSEYKHHWTSSFYHLLQLRILRLKGVYGALNRLKTRTARSAHENFVLMDENS